MRPCEFCPGHDDRPCRAWLDVNAYDMYVALNKILHGKFHIGNDENGNILGPPDSVMCRRIAREAIEQSAQDSDK